jgi:formylglycine-generating enzyme required for sulfatase activity
MLFGSGGIHNLQGKTNNCLMKKLFTLLIVTLMIAGPVAAQNEVNLLAHYTETELRMFLEGKGYTIGQFKTGMPDSLDGAVLFTSFFSIGGDVQSYDASETTFFRDGGISLAGDLQKLACSKVLYTVHGFRNGNTPVILFLGSASWIYELSYSNVDLDQLEYFRIYSPSVMDNTLRELAYFLATEFRLVIRKPEIEWVSIPAGKFIMGASKKEQKRYLMPYSTFGGQYQHEEFVQAFEMSKFEITYDQYDLFCRATGRKLISGGEFGRGNRPVIFVSYFDAVDFAEWMGCRLPTEEEWEYACRAGTTTYYYTGNILCCDQENVYQKYDDEDCSGKNCNMNKTMPVGSYPPNPWGLYDMHGNVSEWTSSWFDNYITYKPLENGSKTVKGGSYATKNVESTSATRFGMKIRIEDRNYIPNYAGYVGFRLVRDVR